MNQSMGEMSTHGLFITALHWLFIRSFLENMCRSLSVYMNLKEYEESKNVNWRFLLVPSTCF